MPRALTISPDRRGRAPSGSVVTAAGALLVVVWMKVVVWWTVLWVFGCVWV